MKEQDLSQVFFDMQTVANSCKYLNDSDLYDLCIMDIQIYQRVDLDDMYDKLAAGEKLTADERKELERFYTLVSVDFLVKE